MPSSTPQGQRISLAPKNSPRSSPKRRPLREKSQSQANELARPSIRIIEEEEDSPVYKKSPFPTQPAHVLSPHDEQGWSFGVSQDDAVSDSKIQPSTTTNESLLGLLADIPRPLQLRKPHRASGSTSTSDAETFINPSIFTSKSSRFSQATTPPVSPTPHDEARIGRGLADTFDEAYVRVRGKSPVHSSTIRPVIPSSPNDTPRLRSSPSNNSFSFASFLGSTDTLPALPPLKDKFRRVSENSNYVVYKPEYPPRDPSRPSTTDTATSSAPSSKQASTATPTPSSPPFVVIQPSSPPYETTQPSEESLAASSSQSSLSSDRPRSASAPLTSHAELAAAIESDLQLQYPTVRHPSISSSFAETSIATPIEIPKLRKKPRMVDPRVALEQHQWSSQLSTIESESDRISQSLSNITELSEALRPARGRRYTDQSSSISQNVGPPSSG
ncbi:hypothetical protein LTS18_013015, partial [Coniosporium uncinatum]